MTDCITAEEYKPENVLHTEQDALYKPPTSIFLTLTVQVIVVIKMCARFM